jgi:hypothetical protein
LGREIWTKPGRGGCRRPAPDVVRERGREHQVLALRRQQLDDPADVADEAHVQHAVGLVQDEDLHVAEIDGALAGVVEQAAGRRDDDLRAGLEGADLGVEPDAAVDGGRLGGRSPP